MDVNPASPAPDPDDAPAASVERRPPAATDEPERYGPLDLQRTAKADGRALLLFTRRDGES
jgi:hypothetical protein